MKHKFLLPLTLALIIILLPFFTKLPIPADTIPGLYYPMRDINYGYPNGTPVKNPLITDPVRQQFAWKWLAVEQIKSGEWPLWNPYNFSGTPLLANIQAGALYPLNVLFFIPNLTSLSNLHFFAIQWSWFIYLQLVLSFYFLYLYLRKTGISKTAAVFGGLVWALCGFNTAWWQWGNVGHTILWFPLILYAIEKLINTSPIIVKDRKAQKFSRLKSLVTFNYPSLTLLCALIASFLAGHLQAFSFVIINTVFYLLFRIPIFTLSKNITAELTARRRFYWVQIFKVFTLFTLVTAVQWLPAWEFIQKSARNIDMTQWQRIDWFYPYQHFIQILAPDFFGNPTTYNYWGVWNYGEYASYIGIIPLLFALGIVLKFLYQRYENIKSKKENDSAENTLDVTESNIGVGFFLFCCFINLFLITRNPLTELPYRLNLPFVSSTQPSRGIAMVDLSLAVLAAVGLHYFLKNKLQIQEDTRKLNNFILWAAGILLVSALGIFTTSIVKIPVLPSSNETIDIFQVAQRNTILPILIILASLALIIVFSLRNSAKIFLTAIFLITIFDLGRYFLKFQSFSLPQFLYPNTSLIQTIQKDPNYRYMTNDSRIMAPNMNIPYRIKTTEGYDPLYLEKYGQFIGMWERNEPDLSPYPANRILTPHNPNSKIADVAAVKYLFTLDQLPLHNSITQLQTEGQTRLYQRHTALPYISLLPAMRGFTNEQQLANYMFSRGFNPQFEGLFILNNKTEYQIPENGTLAFLGQGTQNKILSEKRTDNTLELHINIQDTGSLLYIANTFDEGWKGEIQTNRQSTKPISIIRTNFTFQGIQLPTGDHTITLRYIPQSFTTGLTLSTIGLVILLSILGTNVISKRSSNG